MILDYSPRRSTASSCLRLKTRPARKFILILSKLMRAICILSDIPLSLIDENPFNSRRSYVRHEDLKLSNSLNPLGLMTPVRVRKTGSRYQLVYGHRRVRAARMLSWSTIKAEVEDLSDEMMLKFSLIENMERKNLSDFETATSFWRMNRESARRSRKLES